MAGAGGGRLIPIVKQMLEISEMRSDLEKGKRNVSGKRDCTRLNNGVSYMDNKIHSSTDC